MSQVHQAIVIVRQRDEELSLDELAARTGLHPELIERYAAFGLIEPLRVSAGRVLYAAATIPRLRAIERLRHDLGANLASLGVILDLLERVEALERELSRLRL